MSFLVWEVKKPPIGGTSPLSRSHSRNCAHRYSETIAPDGVIGRERGLEVAERKSSFCVEIRSFNGYAVEASPTLSKTTDCNIETSLFRSMAILTWTPSLLSVWTWKSLIVSSYPVAIF